MMGDGVRLAEAAAGLVGVPFRLHGRDPRYGLDCLGLVIASLSSIGKRIDFPTQYGLRNVSIEKFIPFARTAGLRQAWGTVDPGDILLVKPGPGQHHLLIAQGCSLFTHAHAGLKRVVKMPGPLPWPIERHWRLSNET